jgi:hypothetical protein
MTDQTSRPRKLLTYGQTAERWSCSPRTVKHKAERGEIEVIYLGERMPRISEETAEKHEAACVRRREARS